jgi:hypothetical protein
MHFHRCHSELYCSYRPALPFNSRHPLSLNCHGVCLSTVT